MNKGQNTRRQFAGFHSQQRKNDGELCSVDSRRETQNITGEENQTELTPVYADNHSADALKCPLKESDGTCDVYGTPCQYSNRLNCADYHEYRRRK
jgi:hypothetical protein